MTSPPDVLAFHFSPRKGGNSDLLLDAFLEGVKETGVNVERFNVRELDIHGCLSCGGCDDDGECVVQDDMQDLYPLLIKTRRIVVASPVFFYGPPSEGKALIDRCQALWNRTRLFPELKREDGRGFYIGVGATRGQDLFTGSLLTIKYFLDALGLPKEVESLSFRRIDARAAIKDHPSALSEAKAAGLAFPKE